MNSVPQDPPVAPMMPPERGGHPPELGQAAVSRDTLVAVEYKRFLQERFTALGDGERAKVLALIMYETAPIAHPDRERGIGQFQARFTAWDDARRLGLFENLLEDGSNTKIVSQALLEVYRHHFPALLAAIEAHQYGDSVGLLTARGGRDAHGLLLESISRFVGFEIPRELTYFVNDSSLNRRLTGEHSSTAARKRQVLEDFLNGFRIAEDGHVRVYERHFRRVFFYDDEQKNLDMVQEYARQHGITQGLITVDARNMSHGLLWRNIEREIERRVRGESKPGTDLHIFDIDGTLIDAGAHIYIRNSVDGAIVLRLTQEEFAMGTEAEHMTRAREAASELQVDELVWDFDDFRVPERIAQQVRPDMFKRVVKA